MDFSEIDLSRAKWISPEAEDPAFPRKDATRTFVPVTLSDSDFDSCPDFGSHAGYLRKHFTCSPGTENDLFLTAHGVCDVYLNGQKVSDELLSPGRSNYYMHQPMRRYDVGSCGNGWYRGSSGQDGTKFLFGKDLSLLLLLYCDGKAVLVSDTDWDASTDGPIRGNDMDQGEIIDATRQVTYLRKGREVRLTKDLIYLSTARPIRRKLHEREFPARAAPLRRGHPAGDPLHRGCRKECLRPFLYGHGLSLRQNPQRLPGDGGKCCLQGTCRIQRHEGNGLLYIVVRGAERPLQELPLVHEE